MLPTRIFRTAGFRLAAIYAGLFGLSVLVLFGVIYWITSNALQRQLAANIENEAVVLAEDFRNAGPAHAADAIERRLAAARRPAMVYLLLDPAGRKVAGNIPVRPPRAGWQELPLPTGVDAVDRDESEDEAELRLLAFGIALPRGSFLLVGEDSHSVIEVEEAIVRAFGWAFGATVLLGVAGGFLLSVGFLRQVDAINRTSRAIIEGRLADRIATRGTGDELDRLAVNLNEMLDRVQALMESVRQVSNDIAHDLRTPLSRLRQRLEGAGLTARGVEDYVAAIDMAIADTDAILGTFAALLRIAQIESGSRKAAFQTVYLSGVFHSIIEVYRAVAEDRNQRLSDAVEPDISVRGDRELLTQMLANLVENAIRHTPEGTCITIALDRQPTGPVGIVADDGPGLPAEARAKVFERFFRLERSRSTPGSGLGLSLVAAVADLHDIAITLADNGPGLKVQLDFGPASHGPRSNHLATESTVLR